VKRNRVDDYSMNSQRDAILKNPGMFIGAIAAIRENMWVLSDSPTSPDPSMAVVDEAGLTGDIPAVETGMNLSGKTPTLEKAAPSMPRKTKLVLRSVMYNEGLVNVFKELINNAADNRQRDLSTNCIRVTVDRNTGCITLRNNGPSLPVAHCSADDERIRHLWVGELVFSHFYAGSNTKSGQGKKVGGTNGIGAKIANILASWFEVEFYDHGRNQTFYKRWTDNMGSAGPAIVTPGSGTPAKYAPFRPPQEHHKVDPRADWFRVSLRPDYRRFGYPGDALDQDTFALIRKVAWDIAGTAKPGMTVVFNGAKIPIRSFRDLVALTMPAGHRFAYFPNVGHPIRKAATTEARGKEGEVADHWQVAVAVSPTGEPLQVSYVNNVLTRDGGTHVDAAVQPLCTALCKEHGTKFKKMKLTAASIRPRLWVFVNAVIVDPTFSTQMKYKHTTLRRKFGSGVTVSLSHHVATVWGLGLRDELMRLQDATESRRLGKAVAMLNKGTRKRTLVGEEFKDLEDAKLAGSSRSGECTLILTEGKSAKAMAMCGLSVVGLERYGVFPLKGKPMNVRKATLKKAIANVEIATVMKIMNLVVGLEYDDSRKGLRYGRIMIMADQDHDGSHIKGLIINLFHVFWPSLLSTPGFMTEFITPIVKSKKGRRDVAFYTMPSFEDWCAANNGGVGWHHQYYKGLGTSTATEAKGYFRNMERHTIAFEMDADAPACLDMAFGKEGSDARKQWLASVGTDCRGVESMEQLEKMSLSRFVNEELVLFSVCSNRRAIASIADSFVEGTRKVMHGLFKRRLVRDVKVAQFAAYVADNCGYHHGEKSLEGCIVSLAACFPGKQQLPLLVPSGQFGSRASGGDASSARYIMTRASPWTWTLFNEHDLKVAVAQREEGQEIEPVSFHPILCLALVTLTAGIGTGWSSSVPSYNPLEVIANQERWLDGRPLVHMHPYAHGCGGPLIQDMNCRYRAGGVVHNVSSPQDDTAGLVTVKVTDVPVNKWTKQFNDDMQARHVAGDFVRCAKDDKYHENGVALTITMTQETYDQELHRSPAGLGIHGILGLHEFISTANMVLFDHNGRTKVYSNELQILDEWMHVRLDVMAQRKVWLLREVAAELARAENVARFLMDVTRPDTDPDRLVIRRRPLEDIVADLRTRGYHPNPSTLQPRRVFATHVATTNPCKEGTVHPDVDGAKVGGKPSDHPESMESMESTEPSEPMEPSEPTEPTEPMEPTEPDDDQDGGVQKGEYAYLLGLRISDQSRARYDRALTKLEELKQRFRAVAAKSPREMWRQELSKLQDELEPLLYAPVDRAFTKSQTPVRPQADGWTPDISDTFTRACETVNLSSAPWVVDIRRTYDERRQRLAALQGADNRYIHLRSADEQYRRIVETRSHLPVTDPQRCTMGVQKATTWKPDRVSGTTIRVREARDCREVLEAMTSVFEGTKSAKQQKKKKKKNPKKTTNYRPVKKRMGTVQRDGGHTRAAP
jgi:DNA topoisomerase-2